MQIAIALWRSKYRGGYYWHVPSTPVRWSGDLGTASREAMVLAEQVYPDTRNFLLSIIPGL